MEGFGVHDSQEQPSSVTVHKEDKKSRRKVQGSSMTSMELGLATKTKGQSVAARAASKIPQLEYAEDAVAHKASPAFRGELSEYADRSARAKKAAVAHDGLSTTKPSRNEGTPRGAPGPSIKPGRNTMSDQAPPRGTLPLDLTQPKDWSDTVHSSPAGPSKPRNIDLQSINKSRRPPTSGNRTADLRSPEPLVQPSFAPSIHSSRQPDFEELPDRPKDFPSLQYRPSKRLSHSPEKDRQPPSGSRRSSPVKDDIAQSDIVDLSNSKKFRIPLSQPAGRIPNIRQRLGPTPPAGGFGSHAKPNSAGKTGGSGTFHRKSSKSPTQGAGKVTALLVFDDSEDEEEETLENERSRRAPMPRTHREVDDDPILDSTNWDQPPSSTHPRSIEDDEVYEVTSEHNTGNRVTRSTSAAPPRVSPLRKSPAKHFEPDQASTPGVKGKRQHVGGRNPNAPIPSSIPRSRGPTVTRPLKAWLQFDGKTCMFKVNSIKIDKQINFGPECPLMSIRVALSGGNADTRSLRGNLIDRYAPENHNSVDFIFAFERDSNEWAALHRAACTFLRNGGVTPIEMQDAAAQSLLDYLMQISVEPVEARGKKRRHPASSVATQGWQLKEQERWSRVPASLSPPPEVAASSSKVKGKGKAESGQTTLSFGPAQMAPSGTRRSTRQSNGRTTLPKGCFDAGSDIEEVQPPRAASAPLVPGLSPEERNQILFPYPLTGRAEINISKGDRHRIVTDDFLNDTILEFGLKHVLSQLEDARREEVHMFNSFFYNKVSDRKNRWNPETGKWPAYDSVKKWTKNKDIFNKKYILVPVNEHFHWYLAIIYNPRGILRPSPPKEESVQRRTRSRTSTGQADPDDPEALAAAGSNAPSPVTEVEIDMDDLASIPDQTLDRGIVDEEGDTNMADELLDDEAQGGIDESRDPLDIIDEIVEGEKTPDEIAAVRQRVDTMSLDRVPERHSSPDVPIMNPMLEMIQKQNQEAFGLNAASGGLEEVVEPVKSAKSSLKEDRKILDGQDCYIMTFDSLGGGHAAVSKQLNRWLHFEARDKQIWNDEAELTDAIYVEARVPQQPNFQDCGLFLIHYVEQFLNHPEEVIRFIEMFPPPMRHESRSTWEAQLNKAWRAEDTGNLRETWRAKVDSLAEDYAKLVGDAGAAQESNAAVPDASQDSIIMPSDPAAPPPPPATLPSGAPIHPMPGTFPQPGSPSLRPIVHHQGDVDPCQGPETSTSSDFWRGSPNEVLAPHTAHAGQARALSTPFDQFESGAEDDSQPVYMPSHAPVPNSPRLDTAGRTLELSRSRSRILDLSNSSRQHRPDSATTPPASPFDNLGAGIPSDGLDETSHAASSAGPAQLAVDAEQLAQGWWDAPSMSAERHGAQLPTSSYPAATPTLSANDGRNATEHPMPAAQGIPDILRDYDSSIDSGNEAGHVDRPSPFRLTSPARSDKPPIAALPGPDRTLSRNHAPSQRQDSRIKHPARKRESSNTVGPSSSVKKQRKSRPAATRTVGGTRDDPVELDYSD